MDMLKFKIPLIINLPKPIKKGINGYPTYNIEANEIDFNSISKDELDNLFGQYDWIDVCLDGDYYKKMLGFNNKDVLMDVVYSKGYYFVTLVSDKPFNTMVLNNQFCSSDGPWDKITLKEAVIRFLEGSLSNGIGENEIGSVTYQHEKCEVWLGDLIEI